MSNTDVAIYKTESRELEHMKPSRLNDSLFSKELAPHYMQLAGKLASSELVPKSYRGKPQDLFLCWALGYQIGMSPEQAMQCIAIINGKACMWGDEMLALCMAHKEFNDIVEEPILKDGAIIGYNCTVKRKGKADKVNVFTLDMAKKAGLLAKGGVWIQYPERMLKLRARGFSLRDAFPDALKGIKSREEVEDYIDAEYKVEDDKTMSRPELLKRDYTRKKGAANADFINGSPSDIEDQMDIIPTAEKNTDRETPETPTETIDLRSEITRLLAEKHLPESRIEKALKYYEVNFIEELSDDSAQHFINELMKL